MRSIYFLVMILTSVLSLSAQTKISDRDFEGLIGKVASVKLEWKQIKTFPGQSPKPDRFFLSTEFYDLNGRQTETHYESGNKTIYSVIDGFRTFNTVSPPPRPGESVMTATFDTDKIPVEMSEKITKPDVRYEYKLTYEYDSKGRIIKEIQFGNNGKVWYARSFEYDKAGRLETETKNDTVAITKYKYTYDNSGLLVESFEDRNIKGAGRDSTEKIVYSKYVVDSQGNWTSREAHIFYIGKAMPEYDSPAEKYDTIRTEHRTITYHK